MNWWVNIGVPANLKAALRSNEQGATTDADITYDSTVLLGPRRKPANELRSELPRLRPSGCGAGLSRQWTPRQSRPRSHLVPSFCEDADDLEGRSGRMSALRDLDAFVSILDLDVQRAAERFDIPSEGVDLGMFNLSVLNPRDAVLTDIE